jgi:hypothetical protein
MEVSCLALPAPAKVIEANLATGRITDHRISPAGQVHAQTSRLVAEQFEGVPDRLGQTESLAGGSDGRCVANFCLNLHYMTHANISCGLRSDGKFMNCLLLRTRT